MIECSSQIPQIIMQIKSESDPVDAFYKSHEPSVVESFPFQLRNIFLSLIHNDELRRIWRLANLLVKLPKTESVTLPYSSQSISDINLPLFEPQFESLFTHLDWGKFNMETITAVVAGNEKLESITGKK